MIGVLRFMPKVRDEDIKKLSLPSKKDFIYALERVADSKSSPKQSKT